jgi:tRNA uridine 5-carbamoylmethylation protein Kti12
MFELEKANYDLPSIKFECDNVLAPHIKEPFPNQSFFLLLAGKPGSGKTTFLLQSLISKGDNRIYRKVFDKIVIVIPENSRKSIKNNPFEDLPADQQYESFTPEVIEKVKSIREEYDELNKKKKRPRNTLLIMDDITSQLKDKHVMKSLIELATNRRHLKLSIILLVQYIRSVPRAVRSQITDVCLWKPSNGLDLKIIAEELVSMKRDDFVDLVKFTFHDAHDNLYINKNNETMFKNLQKIIFAKKEVKEE